MIKRQACSDGKTQYSNGTYIAEELNNYFLGGNSSKLTELCYLMFDKNVIWRHLKLLTPVILHILPACSTGTLHVEPYGPPQLICSLSRDVTGHLVLVVSVSEQLLLPSGIVSQLTSVLVQLSQHSVGI